jgi:hypothetical protein
MTLGDISVPFLVAVVAFVTAVASIAGRARDKATITAYKDNAEAQDLTIKNQGETIGKQAAEIRELQGSVNVLERTANSADKIDAQTAEIVALARVVQAGNTAIDEHAGAAEEWWSQLHTDLGQMHTSIKTMTDVLKTLGSAK